METLAYLHLALAHEAPADTDYTASISTWENPKLFARFNQQKLSTSAALPLLSLMIALGVIGMASQALALVQEGDRGAEVTSLQQRLQQLGYFKANITGFFGSVTKEAVIQFQQAKGLTPDGLSVQTLRQPWVSNLNQGHSR
jgi:peptidoglycan hydrolase-like protein with peptidoglycan-binding domain